MHIPDGFLDTKSAVAAWGVSSAGLGFALRRARRMPAGRVPLMGLTAAFVFAAQMLNFPVAGGTSGHLVGAVLVAALLGPSAAVIVISAVLLVQCFLFADGGILALGANILNMALVGSLTGYWIYRGTWRLLGGDRGRIVGIAFGAWCSTVLAAVCCAGELAASGTVSWSAAFPAMANVHMLIGLGEGFITALVIAALRRTRPELLEAGREATTGGRLETVVYGLIVSFGLALFVAPFACPWPDGLEKVANALGIERKVAAPILPAPWARYHIPGIGSAVAATALAGLIGTITVFGLALLLGRSLVPGRNAGKAARPESVS